MSRPAAAPPEPKAMGVTAFARLVGVRRDVIRAAISNGRIGRGVGVDALGRSVIVDVDVAREEFEGNRDETKRPVQDTAMSGSFFADRRRLLRAQSRKIEIQNRERLSRLVSARVVAARYGTRAIIA